MESFSEQMHIVEKNKSDLEQPKKYFDTFLAVAKKF